MTPRSDNRKEEPNLADEAEPSSAVRDDSPVAQVEEAEENSPHRGDVGRYVLSDEALSVIETYRDRLRRMQADFDNYRKRSRREAASVRTDAENDLLTEYLSIVDSIEACLTQAMEADVPPGFVQGLELIHGQAGDLLNRKGVERVPGVGSMFDPAVHECLGQTACDDVDDGAVARELRAGYVRGEKLLRPSQVLVAAGPAETGQEPAEDEGVPVRVNIR
jgi:molecular chaperone GrpE